MPKLPEFTSKPIIGLEEKDWGKQTVGLLNKKDAQYAKTDYLRFKPELVYKLAKPFTSAQSMIDYKGENEEQINSAGYLIMHQYRISTIERPEWFDDINIQTKEEVTNEAQSYTKWADIPYNIQQKLWRHYEPIELRKVLPNIKWGRIYWEDDMLVEQLSRFKDAASMRRHSSQMKNLASRISTWGNNFPKAYELYKSMLGGEQKRSKRGNYQQRTPAIEQYDLDGNYIKTFQTWDNALEEGFKRSSIASAIRGTDGHNKHKGFLWKHEGQEFTK